MENFSNKVLEKIKQQAIKPYPRWHFLLLNSALWLLTALMTILGGVAFSFLVLFSYFQRTGIMCTKPRGNLHWLFVSTPYAWLLIFLILIGVIYYNIKHLKRNYKYPVYLLIAFSFFGSVIIGFMISGMGAHRRLNDEFSRRLPFYGKVFDPRLPSWGRPGEGFLAGKVKKIESDYFIIDDFNNNEWKIIIQKNIDNEDEDNDNQALILKIGEKFMISGHPDKQGLFFADKIMLWDGCHGACKLKSADAIKNCSENCN